MPFELPNLPYPYDALEPHIDAETMRIHHDLHHKAYVDNANAALDGTDWADRPVETVLGDIEIIPEAVVEDPVDGLPVPTLPVAGSFIREAGVVNWSTSGILPPMRTYLPSICGLNASIAFALSAFRMCRYLSTAP